VLPGAILRKWTQLRVFRRMIQRVSYNDKFDLVRRTESWVHQRRLLNPLLSTADIRLNIAALVKILNISWFNTDKSTILSIMHQYECGMDVNKNVNSWINLIFVGEFHPVVVRKIILTINCVTR